MALPGSGKQFVREHTPRHARLLHETLTQFENHPRDWHDFQQWFYQLPLFVDAGRFRVGGATESVLSRLLPPGHGGVQVPSTRMV